MVIQKMGHEALHLGHNYQSVSELEENTLVSGLCDLLERIWSHGIQRKHVRAPHPRKVLNGKGEEAI